MPPSIPLANTQECDEPPHVNGSDSGSPGEQPWKAGAGASSACLGGVTPNGGHSFRVMLSWPLRLALTCDPTASGKGGLGGLSRHIPASGL